MSSGTWWLQSRALYGLHTHWWKSIQLLPPRLG
jgi:hypothetical protein